MPLLIIMILKGNQREKFKKGPGQVLRESQHGFETLEIPSGGLADANGSYAGASIRVRFRGMSCYDSVGDQNCQSNFRTIFYYDSVHVRGLNLENCCFCAVFCTEYEPKDA